MDVDIVDTWPGALAHYHHDLHQSWMPFGEGLRGEELEVFILRNLVGCAMNIKIYIYICIKHRIHLVCEYRSIV